MTKLKICNIGPVKENDIHIDFSGITLFIGDQGSGKSTIAKVFSTLSWIEKSIFKGDFTIKYLESYNRFKKHFLYQNIFDYFQENTFIDYQGEKFNILYQNGQLKIKERKDPKYIFPKIMYIPAERNFVSSVDRPDLIKRLPLSLYTFLDEYENAKKNLDSDLILPFGNIKFQYRKQSKKSFLLGDNYKVDLLQSSSGYQSSVPLLLVANYLTDLISNKSNGKESSLSINEIHKIRNQIKELLKNKLSEDVKSTIFQEITAKLKYSGIISIVEEPEQNLYPDSQRKLLFELFKYYNKNSNNKLILTTHSPYILNYLTQAVKAHQMLKKCEEKRVNDFLLESLKNLIPIEAAVSSDEVAVYQLTSCGKIQKLVSYQGLPSDDNYLNNILGQTNDVFISLLNLEDRI